MTAKWPPTWRSIRSAWNSIRSAASRARQMSSSCRRSTRLPSRPEYCRKWGRRQLSARYSSASTNPSRSPRWGPRTAISSTWRQSPPTMPEADRKDGPALRPLIFSACEPPRVGAVVVDIAIGDGRDGQHDQHIGGVEGVIHDGAFAHHRTEAQITLDERRHGGERLAGIDRLDRHQVHVAILVSERSNRPLTRRLNIVVQERQGKGMFLGMNPRE